jgi:hypothetical protein
MADILDERRKQEIENRNNQINMILGMAESNFARAAKIRDPMTRHILFLEKLLTVKDAMT